MFAALLRVQRPQTALAESSSRESPASSVSGQKSRPATGVSTSSSQSSDTAKVSTTILLVTVLTFGHFAVNNM